MHEPDSEAVDTDAEMAAQGLHRVRTLVQLRRPLPLDEPSRAHIRSIDTRAYRPGRDDADWLAVNNSAFSWHPEQGGWDPSRLEATLAEPWVDLDGFLVHEGADGHLDGFCWTKVHPPTDSDPALGEIWVIGADPSCHGTGLGPALVAAGLDHLADRGLGTAVLYTEEGNDSARRMYDRMGFSLHERRGGYA